MHAAAYTGLHHDRFGKARCVEETATEKVQSVVLNADRDAAPFISSPTEEIKRLAMEMYGLRLENAAGKQTAAARTSETSGSSGKKAAEGVAKKPSAKQVREAVEKLDSEIREINRAVSYTNLDVYKRQALHHIVSPFVRNNGTSWYVPGTEVT